MEVELHPTFANPFRVLKEPPFELEETGYASFTPKLTICFNAPHAKPYPVQCDMNLKLGKCTHCVELRKIIPLTFKT